MTEPKGLKDAFASFFEEPTRETLRGLLQGHVGETRSLDFKATWPDSSAVAKQCLGMANCGGGCLVIGVEEGTDKSLDPVGLTAFKDKADVTNGLKNYLPSGVLKKITVLDFSFESAEYAKIVGKKFQVLIVEFDINSIPVVSLKGGTGIRGSAIYYRKEGVTEEATSDELQSLLSQRITSADQQPQRDLQHHLDQLKVLYGAVKNSIQSKLWGNLYSFQQ